MAPMDRANRAGTSAPELTSWAGEVLGTPLGGSPGAAVGSQAQVTFLEGPDGSAVLKVLLDDDPRRDLRAEFSALERFHEALAGHERVRCPRPIALHSDARAYLMERVPGRPLDEVELEGGRADEAIDSLLEGLAIYHRAVDDLYGDFQPSNVLVAEGRLTLIDPTLPAEIHQRIAATLSHAPASADIGYWVYSVASRAALASIVDRASGRRRWEITQRLLRAAPRRFAVDEESFSNDVRRAVETRLQRLPRSSPMKGRVLELLGRAATGRLLGASG